MKCNKEALIILVICVISVILAVETVSDTTDINVEDSLSVEDTIAVSTEIEQDSIMYVADSIFYDVGKETIYLTGNAQLNYHNSTIKAEIIIINLADNQAYTEGETWIQDGSQIIVGSSVRFDFESQTGIILRGSSRLEKGFYFGEEIRKVGDDVYDIDRGYFTTCEEKEPHFYIYAGRMRLFYRDKIVAKPIIMYVNHFPVLMLPFGTFPVKTERESGILIPEPGYNSVDGKYIENIALYYAYSDYAEILTTVDWREKTGWEARLESSYIKRYYYSGSLLARFQHRIMSEYAARQEWYIRAQHRQDFIDRSSLDANLEFMSSRTVWESSVDADERLREEIRSTIAYRKPFTSTTLNTGATYTDNLTDDTKRIVLPTFSYSLPSKPVHELFSGGAGSSINGRWWENFYYSYSIRGIHEGFIVKPSPSFAEVFYKNVRDEDGRYLARHNAGIRHNVGLSYNKTFAGWLNFSQSINGSEVWFDRDIEGNTFVRGFDYSTNTRLSHSIYGIGSYPNFPVTAVRHIMTPSISYSYSPDYSDRRGKYYSFGGISLNTGERRRNIAFNLNNRWSFKYKFGGMEQERAVNDFFTLNSSVSYDLEKDEKPFSDINHSANFRPGSFSPGGISLNYTAGYNARQDAYNFEILNWRLNNSLRISGNAPYRNYFPKEKNIFFTGRGFQPDYADTLRLGYFDDMGDIAGDVSALSAKHPWNINFNHDLSKVVKTKAKTQNLRTSLSFRLTHNWAINYSNSYNMETKETVSQSLAVDRNLGCWRILFTWSKQGDYWHYRLLFHNIQLPDVLRIRRTDYRR